MDHQNEDFLNTDFPEWEDVEEPETVHESMLRLRKEVEFTFLQTDPYDRKTYALTMTDLHYFRLPHEATRKGNISTIKMSQETAQSLGLIPESENTQDTLLADDMLSEEEVG